MAEPPIINYGSAAKRRTFLGISLPVWLTAIAIIALIVSILMIISILIPTLARMRERCCSIPCASNLRQIGQAMQLYAQDNGGVYPPDFPTILLTQSISPEAFVCPSTSDTLAKGRTPQEQAAQLMSGHCSYIYVGGHFTTKTHPDCVVAFEDPANHVMDGSNVLFADGHVEYLQMDFVAPLISELEQGYNPPRLTTFSSKQQARAMYQRDWVPKLQSIRSGQWSASLPATRPATQPTK